MATNTLTLPEALLRHVIGLEQFSRFADAARETPNYPPHSIEQLSEDRYKLTLAVAGFSREEINVTVHKGVLHITGEKIPETVDGEQSQRVFLHRGISFRDWWRRFNLADFVTVTGVSLQDGLLMIDLERQVPEEAKPRRIAIS